MTNQEIIVELNRDLYVLRQAYKKSQKDADDYRGWWLEELAKNEKIKNNSTELKPKK